MSLGSGSEEMLDNLFGKIVKQGTSYGLNKLGGKISGILGGKILGVFSIGLGTMVTAGFDIANSLINSGAPAVTLKSITLASTHNASVFADIALVEQFSPADLHVYDINGSHLGVNESGILEGSIPGVAYSGPDSDPEHMLLFNNSRKYIIKTTPENQGYVDLHLSSLSNNKINKYEFNNIKINDDTESALFIRSDNDKIMIDIEGDKIYDNILFADKRIVTESNCDNRIDDDADGKVDCADEDCDCNKLPVAIISAPKKVLTNELIEISGKYSYDPDGHLSSFLWKDNDTIISDVCSFNMTLPTGEHHLTLIVTDNDGKNNTIYQKIEVKDAFIGQTSGLSRVKPKANQIYGTGSLFSLPDQKVFLFLNIKKLPDMIDTINLSIYETKTDSILSKDLFRLDGPIVSSEELTNQNPLLLYSNITSPSQINSSIIINVRLIRDDSVLDTENFRLIAKEDIDDDLVPDIWEEFSGLNASFNDSHLDPDNDNLINYKEYIHYTNPLLNDTDDGGIADGEEILLGKDPLDPADDLIFDQPIKINSPKNQQVVNSSALFNITTSCPAICRLHLNERDIDEPGGWCYQESVDESTSCGGLDSGSYSLSGDWTIDGGSSVVDGNWSTYDKAYGLTQNHHGYVYMNYAIPDNALSSSLWQIRGSDGTENLSISDCDLSDVLRLRVDSYYKSQSQRWIYWQCIANSDWLTLIKYTSGTANHRAAYEEALWWDLDNMYSEHHTWIQELRQGINDVRYTCVDLEGNIFSSETYHLGLVNISSFDIPLVVGWNLISLPVYSSNLSVSESLRSLEGKYSTAFGYDSESGGIWASFNPNRPGFLNTLTELAPSYGYWIYLEEEGTLGLEGVTREEKIINLKQGWNLIGYPSLDESPVEGIFGPISDDLESIFQYKAVDSGNEWKSYNPDRPAFLNTLATIEPGYGYWVKVTEDTELEIS